MAPTDTDPVTPTWPYDWQAVDNGLDLNTIEEQGEFLLHRALNIKRLIAFVGSGVSMAYGRVSWSELATLHIERMQSHFAKKEPLRPADQRHSLVEYLSQLHRDGGPFAGDKLYPALQACEQIWALTAQMGNEAGSSEAKAELEELASTFGFDWDYESKRFNEKMIYGAACGHALFRSWIKRETYDELAHVKRLIRGWQPEGNSAASIDDLLKIWVPDPILEVYQRKTRSLQSIDSLKSGVIELIERRPLVRSTVSEKPRHYLAFFDKKFVNALHSAAFATSGRNTPTDQIIDKLGKAVKQIAKESQTTFSAQQPYISPVRQFAIGLALDVARLAIALGTPAPLKPAPSAAFTSVAAVPPKPSRSNDAPPAARGEIVAPEHDPLHLLAYELNISRFMTTNYDLEIERMFTDMGFKREADALVDHPAVDLVQSIGPSGGRTREIVLTERSAIDLVDFAANDSPYEFQVVHLHGRATEHHDIVVTEADYHQKYLSDTAAQMQFREGLEIAFGGNPVLFLGLGLGEGDIMRPLREFMTNTSRRNRSIFALRDGRDSEIDRQTFAKKIYAQYGVHVLHYGRVTRCNRKDIDDRPYWLAMMAKQIRDLVLAIDELANLLDPPKGQEPKKPEKFANEVASIKKKLKQDVQFKIQDKEKTWSVIQEDFESDGHGCDIKFEVALLETIKNLVPIVVDIAPHTPPNQKARLPEHDKALAAFLRSALRDAAQRTESAIVTAALNAKLAGIKDGWSAWWQQWQTVPKSRTAFAEYEPINQADHVWGRHIVHDRPSGETPPRTLSTFLRLVPALANNSAGRRVFMLLGQRGAGKGNFYSAFTERGNKLLRNRQKYAGQFFVSFSFSIEIASVWDALIAFLDEPTENPNLFASTASNRREALARLPRIDALRRLLEDRAKARSERQRLLIVFNAFDILVDHRGDPKNSEIGAILDLLLGATGAKASIDIVCICRDIHLPHLFRRPETIVDTDATADRETRIFESRRPFRRPTEDTPRKLTLLLSPDQKKWGLPPDGSDASSLTKIHRDLTSVVKNSYANLDPEPSWPRWLSAEFGMMPEATTNPARRGNRKRVRKAQRMDFLHVIEINWDISDAAVLEMLGTTTLEVMGDLHPQVRDKRTVAKPRRKQNSASPRTEALDLLFERHLERQRFLFTLVAAIAQPSMPATIAQLSTLKDRLREFLERLLPGLRGPRVSVQERVIEAVLDFWFERRELGPETEKDHASHDPVLFEMLLRHLAVISVPVTADVLAACPQITQHLRALSPEKKESRIYEALETLHRRRLAFSLAAPGKNKISESSRHETRYVVHRAIQRHIFRKLGSQQLEPLEGQLFTLSLYATQQRNFPGLNAAAYRFVYDLVDGLCAYPTRQSPPHNDREFAARTLRAALGVTRGLFSIGVVSRFFDLEGLAIEKPPKIGYFEHHRLIVRWLAYYAADLAVKRGAIQPLAGWPPFYRDEQIWLANECGVFSLSQGQAYDATALFWQANRLAGDIEAHRPGAIRSRILLNNAWCCIDRGRLDEAERQFRQVMAAADEEHTLQWVARGGVALVDHIRGRVDTAIVEYAETIRHLHEFQRFRPLSIFQRHLGDLLRHIGDHDRADEMLTKAEQTAETGGYADLTHLAAVARVRNMIYLQATRPDHVTSVLDTAQAYAENMELSRLLCEVLMVRAELLVRQGHSFVAGQFATRALRIATLNGLTLRKIAYLELLSRIERSRGGEQGANRLMTRAIQSARHVGYNLTVERAERSQESPAAFIEPVRSPSH